MSDEFQIEEFKWVTSRIVAFENRYFQMLLYFVTGFVAVLGVSSAVPGELIPYMITPLLLVTSTIAFGDRQNQYFSSAYLLVKYYERTSSISYENAYYARLDSAKTIKSKIQYIKNIVSFFIQPFVLLTFINLLATFYYSKDFYLAGIKHSDNLLLSVYVGGLLAMHTIILWRIVRHRKLGPDYHRKYHQQFLLEKENEKLTTREDCTLGVTHRSVETMAIDDEKIPE